MIGVGSLEGGSLVTFAAGNQIRIWEIDTGDALACFTGDAQVRCLEVKERSSSIIAGDELGKTHILKLLDFRKIDQDKI